MRALCTLMFRVRNILCKGWASSSGCSISSALRDIVKNMRARWWGFGVAAFFPAVLFACGLDDSVVLQMSPDGGGADSTILGSQEGSIDGTTPTGDGSSPEVDAGPPLLIYATTETELYSFDVVSRTLTDIGGLTNCGSPTNFADLAIDPTGAMYMLKLSDAIYKLDSTGNCSDRSMITVTSGPADGPFIDKIGGRSNATPVIVGLNFTNNDLYAIDMTGAPNTALMTKINADLFTDDKDVGAMQFGVYDLACRNDGKCWTALAQGCNPGAGSSCLYTFRTTNGGENAVRLGSIGVEPAGLAYAAGTLYSFGVDGVITKIVLADAGAPAAQSVTINGAPHPSSWTGAASNAGNP